jgi:adenylate cyclase
MTIYPLKDLQFMERIAESYSKAGLPGEPSGFYKISADNRLTGKQIKELFFGRKVTGFTLDTGKQWWIERSLDGKAAVRDGDDADTGKSWIEEDMLCDQWDNLYESLKDCWVVYRNPEGTPENNDEYLGAPGYGIYPFSPIEDIRGY